MKNAGATLKEKHSQALARGYAGLRYSSNKAWLTANDLRDFLDSEKRLKEAIALQRVIFLCTYPLAICRADELFDLAHSHDFAVLRRNGNWEVLETPELNQARAAVRKLNEELERRIEERTRELAAANQDLKREIAERKQAEEALRRERDFAEGMIETAQTIVLALDTQGRIVRFNPYMEKVSGYGLGEVQGKDWFTTFVPEHDRERIHRLFLNAIGNISTHGNVNPIVTKDGREREIEWYDKTLNDPQGNVVGLLAIGQDITERKQAEEAVSKAHAMQRAVFDSTDNFIWSVDSRDFGLLTFNRAFQDYFLQQYSIRLQVGQRLEDLGLTAEYIERWHGYFQRALASGPFTTEYLMASGKITHLLTFNPLIHNDAVFGVSVFGKDITERKRVEEELARE